MTLRSAQLKIRHRVGIIPFELRNNLVAIMLVTSQTRGRWILPKGKQRPSESHRDTCLREGFEEGGVKGIVLENFPITTVISKQTKLEKIRMPVTYYPFAVTDQADDWPEARKRERHWALVSDAPNIVYKEDMLYPIKQFTELLPWIKQAAQDCKSDLPESRTLEQ